MENKKMITEEEKKLLQAKHRMEAVQARDRVKEQKARTRRLIQQGAILESLIPEVKDMEPESVKEMLKKRLCKEYP